MVLEICANSVQSAINAQKGGANRVELCQSLEAGGITPSAATIAIARKKLSIDLFVLIRPRSGNFNYTDIDYQTMLRDIQFCKEHQVEGVVFGILDESGNIDRKRNQTLLEAARPMQCTFHRAFDCLKAPKASLEHLIDLQFDRILTSGLKETALAGKSLIKKLVQQADNRIKILPGSGLNSGNLHEFAIYTQAKEFHLSAKKSVLLPAGGLFDAHLFETDPKEVERCKAILQKLS